MKSITERVTDLLVAEGALRAEQVKEYQAKAASNGGNLLKLLVDERVVSENDMLVSVGSCIRTPPVNLYKMKVPHDIMTILPKEIATNYMAVPVARLANRLYVAMADPLNILAIDDMRRVTQMEIFPLIASELAVKEALQQAYPGVTGKLQQALSSAGSAGKESGAVEGRVEINASAEPTEEVSEEVVVTTVNMLLAQAVRDRASDIHIEPQETSVRVRFSIDGQAHEILTVPKAMQAPIISRLKILSSLDIAEHRLPQDGRLPLTVEGRDVDLRVNVLPTMFGERVCMRLLDKGGLPPNLDGYTNDQETMNRIREAIHRPHGMVLVTGPTGSGKTTTLYRALQELNTPKVNIITVEDPVEYQLPGVNQVQVHAEIGLTFAAGLRAILRQAPNIVLVGEIRDKETADIGVKAALTGHLLLSTLHTNDAPSAVARLVDMGVEPFLVSSTLVMIIAQRLARRICQHCRQPFEPPEALLKRLDLDPKQYKGQAFFRSTGCGRCRQSGFMGRCAVVEVMRINEEIRDLIAKEAPVTAIRQAAERDGMKTLRNFGLELAKQGLTSLEEVLRVTAAD